MKERRERIATELERVRKEAGFTRKEVYEAFHIPKRTYDDWEWGYRAPQKGMDYYVTAVKALATLTSEGRQSMKDGNWTIEDLLDQYKLTQAQKLSKWGEFQSTYEACMKRIPDRIIAKLSADELAELVDQIKATYDQGKADQG